MEEKEQVVEQQIEEMEEDLKDFWQDDRGVGVIEIVLILVILIGLVLIFKEEITEIVMNAFSKITGDANSILK